MEGPLELLALGGGEKGRESGRGPRFRCPGKEGGPHGFRYSMQLLSVCFRPMMMAICRNRSIMQPLRWHCGRGRGGRSGLGGRAVQGQGSKAYRTH